MSSSSPQQYARVQHHDDDDENKPSAATHEPTNDSPSLDSNSHDDNDLFQIQMQSSEDSDAKTEPMSNLRTHLSFDLEEEESELSRYRLDTHSSSSLSQHNSTSSNDDLFSKKLSLSTLYHYYLETRSQHRRRRAEWLLSMNEESWTERLQYALSMWTDVFDNKGLALHVILFIVWIIWCHVHPTKSVILGGILLLLTRILLKPCYWLVYEKRQEEKRQETMAIYDELNGSWNRHHAESHGDDDEEAVLDNIV